jgi:hypothetical protein
MQNNASASLQIADLRCQLAYFNSSNAINQLQASLNMSLANSTDMQNHLSNFTVNTAKYKCCTVPNWNGTQYYTVANDQVSCGGNTTYVVC